MCYEPCLTSMMKPLNGAGGGYDACWLGAAPPGCNAAAEWDDVLASQRDAAADVVAPPARILAPFAHLGAAPSWSLPHAAGGAAVAAYPQGDAALAQQRASMQAALGAAAAAGAKQHLLLAQQHAAAGAALPPAHPPPHHSADLHAVVQQAVAACIAGGGRGGTAPNAALPARLQAGAAAAAAAARAGAHVTAAAAACASVSLSCDERLPAASDDSDADSCTVISGGPARAEQDEGTSAAPAAPPAACTPAKRPRGCNAGSPDAAALAAARPAAVHAAAWCHASAKSRLRCARVSVYTDCSSPSALVLANRIMGRVALLDGVTYIPVAPETLEFALAAQWHFPALAVALGRTYFQRLLRAVPQVEALARSVPSVAGCCAPSQEPVLPLAGEQLARAEEQLHAAQFTCIFLATKVADQVHYGGLLRFVLTALTGQRRAATLEEACDLELRVLDALSWRMGPYFERDPLADGPNDLVQLLCGC